jgi:hypothetical protein
MEMLIKMRMGDKPSAKKLGELATDFGIAD